MQGVDQHFRMEQETEESHALIEQLCSAMLSFLRDLVKLGPAPVTVPSEGIAADGQGEHYVPGHSRRHSPLMKERAALCCALPEMRLRAQALWPADVDTAEAPIAEASEAAAPAHAALAEPSSERQISAGPGDADERVLEQIEHTADPAAEQTVQLSAAEAHVPSLAAEAAPSENVQIVEAQVPNGFGQGAAEQPQDGDGATEAQVPNGFARENLEEPADVPVPMEA